MSATLFQEFLQKIASLYSLDTLRPDQMGACQLFLKKENLHLLFEYDDHIVPDTILVSTSLGEIAIGKEEDVSKKLLKYNEKGEDILSIQPEEPICFLHRRLSPHLEKEKLQESLTTFKETAVYWQQEIQHPQEEEISEQKVTKQTLFPHNKV
jgi:hypothetical protein